MKMITIQIQVKNSVDADILASQIEFDLEDDWGTDFVSMQVLPELENAE